MKFFNKKYRKLILIISLILVLALSTYIYYYKLYIPVLFENPLSNKYRGKKGASFGDSITWYDGHSFYMSHSNFPYKVVGYQEYVRQYFGCQIDNRGENSLDITEILNLILNYDNYIDKDFILLTSGANDARKGVKLGEIKKIGQDHDHTTFIGALQTAIEHILSKNENLDLYLITPINGFFKESRTPSVPGPYNDLDYISEDYATAIIELGKIYNLTVCDWYNNIYVERDNNNLLGDKSSVPFQLHPTNLLYKNMGQYLCEVMDK